MFARTISLTLGLAALASAPSTVLAQGNTFNPYGNSGYADYREYGSPTVSGNTTQPGQVRNGDTPLVSRPRGNSYQQYTEEVDGSDVGTRRGSSNSVPYYEAYQSLNSRYNRVYRPNAEADKKYEERQKQRDQAYANALKEKDPVKRAKMFKDIEQDSIRGKAKARTTASSAAPKPGQTGTAPAPGATSRAPAPGSTSRAPSPYPTTSPTAPKPTTTSKPSSVMDTPAPSPYPTTRTRRAAPAATGTTPGTTSTKPKVDAALPPDPSTIATPPPPR